MHQLDHNDNINIWSQLYLFKEFNLHRILWSRPWKEIQIQIKIAFEELLNDT